jgi:hypothetical protein
MRYCRHRRQQTLHYIGADGPRLPWKLILLAPVIWLICRIVDGAPACQECLEREMRERE